MSVDKMKGCVEATLNLADAIEKLNVGLFGVKVIDNKIKEFREKCNISDTSEIERLIKEGISAVEHKEYAREYLRTAKELALVDGLIALRRI